MTRGRLKVYLGMAPGVGKTYAMLDEGHRRRERGLDVVIGLVETHGRAHTAAQVGDLEQVPRREVTYRGASFSELDLAAVIARHPQLVLVDELAHTNVPGAGHEKRWQDVETILAAGIDVISTLNIQHLESLNDVVARITGIPQRETVPDEVVRRADQLEIIDVSPEALRRRLAHGNVYPAERVDAALANYFRPGNLAALRELALLWMAERVDEGLKRYRDHHHITEPWEARERIVAALSGGPEGATLIRRAARIASRSVGADLLAVHVVRSDGLTGDDPVALAQQRRLVESLGGSWHQVLGDDVAAALLDFARAQNATQLVLGVSRRRPLVSLLSGESVEARVTRHSGPIDVHLVTHELAPRRRSWLRLPAAALNSPLGSTRRWQGVAMAVLALPLLTWLLHGAAGGLNLAGELLLYLVVVIAVALVGGLWPALGSAVAAGLLLTYFFTEPRFTLVIASADNAIAVVAFIAVAALVAGLVERVVARSLQAARAAADAATLAGLAGSILRGETSAAAILDRARETFRLDGVALHERPDAVSEFTEVALSGARPGDDAGYLGLGELHRLAVSGGRPPVASERVLAAFGAQAVIAHQRERLSGQAARAEQITEVDRVRTALLTAVSHELRTPLAAATAAVAGLRSRELVLGAQDRAELLETADESLVRLAKLIDNLLDLSRLQAGALPVVLAPVRLADLVPEVREGLDLAPAAIGIEIPDDLPEVAADAVLLERVLANLIANGVRVSPPNRPLVVTASALGDAVELRVIDHGPGIAPEDRGEVFRAFQRRGDRDATTGVGLGLALALGLTEAMAGTLTLEETPGGGATLVVSLPAARPAGVAAGETILQ